MEKNIALSSRFRKRLRRELQNWHADGLITTEQSAAIAQRYKLDQISTETTNTLMLAVYIIGTVLVAVGVISFVAAHWNNMAAAAKVALIMAFMLTCHLAGYYLWKISGSSPRLGHALVLLGTLVFGANIGLLAQIFHIRENFYNGLLAPLLHFFAM